MGKIRNYSLLATSPLRKICLDLANVALSSIDTASIIAQRVSYRDGVLRIGDYSANLDQKENLYIVCIGKCGGEAGQALENILHNRIRDGIVLDSNPVPTKILRSYQGTHPYASLDNVHATQEILALLDSATEKDFVLFVFSGGGSALLACPSDEMPIEEENRVVNALMRKGASIRQINIVRKHLSRARGGFLSTYSHPAESLALYFSDVPHDDLAWVASGPTVFDRTTSEEAKEILKDFHIAPGGLQWMETPIESAPFSHITNLCFLSNRYALQEMAEQAKRHGYTSYIRSDVLEGDAEKMARNICRELRHCPSKTVLLYGGETTISVRGDGKGGRNLHMALTALPYLDHGEALLALATDGEDHGPWAGALVDGEARDQADLLGIDSEEYRVNFDAYPFFEQLSTYLLTGPTGSNVADILIAAKE